MLQNKNDVDSVSRRNAIIQYVGSCFNTDSSELSELIEKVINYLDNINYMNIKQFKIFENTMELSEQTAIQIVDEYSEFGLELDRNLRIFINKNKGLI